jgi:hypothetical protein
MNGNIAHTGCGLALLCSAPCKPSIGRETAWAKFRIAECAFANFFPDQVCHGLPCRETGEEWRDRPFIEFRVPATRAGIGQHVRRLAQFIAAMLTVRDVGPSQHHSRCLRITRERIERSCSSDHLWREGATAPTPCRSCATRTTTGCADRGDRYRFHWTCHWVG